MKIYHNIDLSALRKQISLISKAIDAEKQPPNQDLLTGVVQLLETIEEDLSDGYAGVVLIKKGSEKEFTMAPKNKAKHEPTG